MLEFAVVRILVAASVAIDKRAMLTAGLAVVRLSETDILSLSEVASVDARVSVVVKVAMIFYCFVNIVIKTSPL